MNFPRFYAYGRWRTSLPHRFPVLSAIDVVNDNPPHAIYQRWYQAAWLGMTLNVSIPAEKTRRAKFFYTYKIAEWIVAAFKAAAS